MNTLLLFFLCANLLLLCAFAIALPKGKRLALMIGLSLFLPGLSLALYAHLGQIWLPDHPLLLQQQRRAEQNEDKVDVAARAAQKAFAALSPEERGARIRGMVATLSERLYRNGGAPQEWLRLARSQSVLHAKDEARAALEQAEELHPALKTQKAWLAASVAVLLATPLDATDKRRVKRQLAEAKALFGSSDTDIKTLEEKLLPLLQ